jgi:hypothetical protein
VLSINNPNWAGERPIGIEVMPLFDAVAAVAAEPVCACAGADGSMLLYSSGAAYGLEKILFEPAESDGASAGTTPGTAGIAADPGSAPVVWA